MANWLPEKSLEDKTKLKLKIYITYKVRTALLILFHHHIVKRKGIFSELNPKTSSFEYYLQETEREGGLQQRKHMELCL
jgi:hypothetical protein